MAAIFAAAQENLHPAHNVLKCQLSPLGHCRTAAALAESFHCTPGYKVVDGGQSLRLWHAQMNMQGRCGVSLREYALVSQAAGGCDSARVNSAPGTKPMPQPLHLSADPRL